MASSSSHQHDVEHRAFSGIEPDTKRRKVSESSRLFDVFINHRGPDAKETLAVPLYSSLQELRLQAFLDREEMELGDYFPSTIETAIRSASVHIAIFSERYAESAWCLTELILMLESGAKIFPIFYGVRPCELRYIENGAYADAFTSYKKKCRYLQKLESWKKALQSASLITGLEIDSAESFRNSEGFKNFVLDVQKEVERTKPLFVAKHPVALHKLVKDFESQCLEKLVHDFESRCGLNRKGKDQSKIVGIFGMGGAGKTTLAKELFNRKRSNYMATCFLFDVREKSSRFGLPSLQAELLRHLFNESPPEFRSKEEGSNYVRDRLGRSRFLSLLIVVDDIDHVKQLDTLCLMDMINSSHNSLVIVTTRDVGVLTSAGITNRYNLKGLNRDDGRELFCWHSFGQPNPASGYENLVDAFIDVCGGLPLSLQVLGRHVYGRPVYYWELQLGEVRKSLDLDIKDILKISFDALSRVGKQIFMDIACFFVDKCKNTAIRVWEGSGWDAIYALETLKDRCLVEEGEGLDGLLWEDKPVVFKMHDHLRDLGREMSEELNSPPRHWSPKHHKYSETKGFENILAQTKGRSFHSFYDRSMGSQVTYFMGESEECKETSSSLLWLQLDLYCTEFSSIPPWIPLQNLQSLRISHGCLKRLWQSNVQRPSQLKELQIYQTTLDEFPDFSGTSNNLEQVVLDAKDLPIDGWSLLESLRVYPRSLVLACSTIHGELACNNRGDKATFKSSRFTSLVIRNFVKLTDELVLHNIGESTAIKCPLSNLENLEINHQIYVTKILICGNYCPSLLSLKIHNVESLIEMNLLGVKTLYCLEINTCRSLKRLSETSNFRNLVALKISECPELEELSVLHLTCLEKISIKNCKQLKIMSGLSDLKRLVELNIAQCPELKELCVAHLTCLEKMTIKNCERLESVSGLSNLKKLVKLDIFHCSVLEFCFVDTSSLKEARVGGCGELKYLELNGCKKLETVEMFNLEKIVTSIFRDCPELQELVIPEGSNFLERIIIRSCQILKSVSGISHLKNLVELNIFQCWELDLLRLEAMNSLERFTIDECPKLSDLRLYRCQLLKNITLPSALINVSVKGCRELQRVACTGDLTKLTWMNISECPELEELPSLSRMDCLEVIEIDSCGKLLFEDLRLRRMQFLQRMALDGNVKVKYFELDSCQNLETIKFGCEKLIELRIQGCPKLEELPAFRGAVCLEKVIIDGCGKLNYLELEGCKNLRSVSGNFELTKLYINQCPQLEELASLSSMRLLEEIDIKHCIKMKNITLPTTVISLSIWHCRDLQRISVTGDFMEITKMFSIWNCAMLEELPMLATGSFTEEIKISDCEKLQNITLPSRVIRLYVRNCRDLQRISVTDDFMELATGSCTEEIKISDCEKLQNITLPSRLITLYVQKCRDLQRISVTGDFMEITKHLFIRDCAMLEDLPMLATGSCTEEIKIHHCEKLQNIMVPSRLIRLYVWNCRDLQRISVTDDFMELATGSCTEEIKIHHCEKLQNITLPSRLIRLYVWNCRDLQRISVTCDFMEITKYLYIRDCAMLEELPMIDARSCVEQIFISGCEKVENITGIKELRGLLQQCINTVLHS